MANKGPGESGGRTRVRMCGAELRPPSQVYSVCGPLSSGFPPAQLPGDLKGTLWSDDRILLSVVVVATLNWKVLFLKYIASNRAFS